jgi:hypothetical protein
MRILDIKYNRHHIEEYKSLLQKHKSHTDSIHTLIDLNCHDYLLFFLSAFLRWWLYGLRGVVCGLPWSDPSSSLRSSCINKYVFSNQVTAHPKYHLHNVRFVSVLSIYFLNIQAYNPNVMYKKGLLYVYYLLSRNKELHRTVMIKLTKTFDFNI